MCVLTSLRHFCCLVIVPFLVVILAFPTSANPATPKTGPNTATPSTETNSPAAKAESEPGSAQPESNPGTRKVGSAIVINIDKTKQEMTVLLDGTEKYHWPVSTGRAGYSTPSGTYTATSMNEI